MKTNKIIIKDVTGENSGYIAELQREGYPSGSIVRHFMYQESNKYCYFGGNCVAYVGETCEFV